MKDIRNFQKEGQMLEFLKQYTWFDLKLFYYSLKSNYERSVEAMSDIDPNHKSLELAQNKIEFTAQCLEMLKQFRLEKIMEILKDQAEEAHDVTENGGECFWIDESTMNQIEELKAESDLFEDIDNLFQGSVNYLMCPENVYIFSYFGSETPTSDLDYGLYNFYFDLKDARQPDFFNELENIVTTNRFVEEVQNEMAQFLRGNLETPADQLLDMNGYPDMYVFYHFFYKNENLLKYMSQDKILDSQYTNYFSSILLRICNFVHIQTNRIFGQHFDKETDKIKNQSISNCYKKILSFKEDFEEKYIKDQNSREKISTSKVLFQQNLTKFMSLIEFYKFDPNKLKLTQHIKNNQDTSGFHGCLSRVQNLDFYLQLMDERTVSRPAVNYKNIKFQVYNKIYYLGNSQDQEIEAYQELGPNWLYMYFIAACFSFANEAYSTIGPLEYVKYQNQLHADPNSGQVITNFMTLWETFLDNFSMIMAHMLEVSEILEEPVTAFQSISDAYCKYLIRALNVFSLSSKNAFGQDVGSLTTQPVAGKFGNHKIYQFYTQILQVPPQNKKAEYFRIFKSAFAGAKVKELALETFKFYHLIFNFVLDNFNVGEIFLSLNTFRRLVIV